MEKCSSTKNNYRHLATIASFFAGDLNCFDFNGNNTSGQLRSFDPRISNFKNIDPLLRLYDLSDSAEKFGRMDFTHYDKTSHTFLRRIHLYKPS